MRRIPLKLQELRQMLEHLITHMKLSGVKQQQSLTTHMGQMRLEAWKLQQRVLKLEQMLR